MDQQTVSKSGKEYVKGAVLSPCLFNLYAEYIMWNAGLDEAQAGIKISVRNIWRRQWQPTPVFLPGEYQGQSLVGCYEVSHDWSDLAAAAAAARNINNLRYADDTTLKAESEELKSFLMKVKEESEKAGLKLNIQKMKIKASSLITSWQIDEETMERVTDYFLGLQNNFRWWLQPWN